MKSLSSYSILLLKNYFFWILIFNFQRVLFSIHHLDSFGEISFLEWLSCFFYSIRLDLATASFLIPLPFLSQLMGGANSYVRRFAQIVVSLLVLIISLVHCAEIIAYTEWQHKLTGRVFTHLSNPDEMFRTSSSGMTIMYFLYLLIELAFAWRMWQWLFGLGRESLVSRFNFKVRAPLVFPSVFFFGLLLRGGFQQIPININAAYFSKHYILNDISTNSFYYFIDSYLLYRRGDIQRYLPNLSQQEAEIIRNDLYNYPKSHQEYVLENQKPNIVFIILESWAAEAIGCINSNNTGATPHFDKLVENGLLFSNIYSGSNTSEIGNLGIFCGIPALPEISIIQRPDKYRKLPTINEDLEQRGYSSHYMFSGDLKYGNIGAFLMDKGFQDVIDEDDFPSGIDRGKLSYYDEDAYRLFLQRLNKTKGPFIHCLFTGSTHSPYDHPKKSNQNWKGEEAEFMNSLIYADECLGKFMNECKTQAWYQNTIFVIMADHGHSAPGAVGSQTNRSYRIPILFYGEPLKDNYQGKVIETVGNQSDLPATLLYQLGLKNDHYRWSKDLLNPFCPNFAFHTVIRGYGWVSDKGRMTYQMEHKKIIENTFSEVHFRQEQRNCHGFLVSFYNFYKDL